MGITVQSFNEGDTDYVAKLNTDFQIVVNAVNALQNAQTGITGGTSGASFGLALFGSSPCLIGSASYACVASGANISVGPGYMWKASAQKVVQLAGSLNLTMSGRTSGAYYVDVDSNGNAVVAASGTAADPIYSFNFDGTSVTGLSRVANVFFNYADCTSRL